MSDSMYAAYLKERTNDRIIENEYGFATYRFVNSDADVYLVDIFVKPEHRKDGHASHLADLVSSIGRKRGCKRFFGSVCPSAKGSTTSMKVLLAYGLQIDSSSNDFILMVKDL